MLPRHAGVVGCVAGGRQCEQMGRGARVAGSSVSSAKNGNKQVGARMEIGGRQNVTPTVRRTVRPVLYHTVIRVYTTTFVQATMLPGCYGITPVHVTIAAIHLSANTNHGDGQQRQSQVRQGAAEIHEFEQQLRIVTTYMLASHMDNDQSIITHHHHKRQRSFIIQLQAR